MEMRRFDVLLVSLDASTGSETKKTRPCLVISPDEMNRHLRTLIVAPMTTQGKNYPTRIQCFFKNKSGQIALDQMRTIDRSRVIKNLGNIDKKVHSKLCKTLVDMFSF